MRREPHFPHFISGSRRSKGTRTRSVERERPGSTVPDPNATQAYRRAFGPCSYHTARTEGPKLLANPAIKAEIHAARLDYQQRVRVNAVKVLRWLAEIAGADPDDCYEPDPENGGLPRPRPWADIPPAARRTIASVRLKRRRRKGAAGAAYEVEEVEYRHHSKDAAIDKLCRKLGLYPDDPAGGDDKHEAGLDILGRLVARLVGQEPPSGGPGGGAGGGPDGDAVDPVPGAAGAGVPQPG
jgi:phage terminase small subunit